jgi:type IV pilus assembly protein PilM
MLSRRARSSASRPVVGLDVEPGFVTAARVRVNGSVTVEQAAGVPLAGDVLRDGDVVDVDSLAEALREMFREHGFERRVRLGMASQRAVLRTIELPPITDRNEIASAVRFQAEDQVPLPLASAVMDFHPLGMVDTPAGQRLRVVLVAAQRDVVERLVAAARMAGLRPEGLDLSAFALIRALHPLRTDEDGAVAYLSVGGLANIAIAHGTACAFTRVLGGGLEAMAVQVAERRGIELAKARDMLFSAGVDPVPIRRARGPAVIPSPGFAAVHEHEGAPEGEPEQPAAQEREDAELDDVRSIIAAGVREIASEVRNSIDFHVAQGAEHVPARVVLSGAAVDLPGFAQRLEAQLDLPVTSSVVSADAGALSGVAASRLTVAAGLAVEEASR